MPNGKPGKVETGSDAALPFEKNEDAPSVHAMACRNNASSRVAQCRVGGVRPLAASSVIPGQTLYR